jgi:prephenate dehydrogenase
MPFKTVAGRLILAIILSVLLYLGLRLAGNLLSYYHLDPGLRVYLCFLTLVIFLLMMPVVSEYTRHYLYAFASRHALYHVSETASLYAASINDEQLERFLELEEVRKFQPELVINAATVKYTIPAFNEVLPFLPEQCILSDIASVKTGLKEYYESTGRRYVSTHPMFGPTFANLNQLSEENAIIISEGDYMGRCFFKDLYSRLDLNIYEYTFEEHDKTVAYSLSIPFVSTFVFSAVMKHQDAPGTTFKRHLRIAKGVLNEDDYLLQEVLFNPYTHDQVDQIRAELKSLLEIIDNKDAEGMKAYLTKIRANVKRDVEALK